MVYDVILTKENKRFIARVKEWPEVVVQGNTKDEAVHRAKSELLDYLTKKVEVVRIDVSLPTPSKNPWLENFGCFKDDPTFEDLQEEIKTYRQEVDSI